jgi:hypothetical protein
MTPRTPQCEVFWALLLSSEHSGVPKDPKPPTFPSVGLHPHTWPKWGCDKNYVEVTSNVNSSGKSSSNFLQQVEEPSKIFGNVMPVIKCLICSNKEIKHVTLEVKIYFKILSKILYYSLKSFKLY